MTFNEWLLKQIEKSGLSYSELGRRSGYSHARISQVVNGDLASADFCIAISKALTISPITALQKAGFLTPLPDDNQKEDELTYLFRQMTDRDQQLMLAQFRAVVAEHKREQRGDLAAASQPT